MAPLLTFLSLSSKFPRDQRDQTLNVESEEIRERGGGGGGGGGGGEGGGGAGAGLKSGRS